MRRASAALDDWHAGGCAGPPPAGRLRAHPQRPGGPLLRRLVTPVYELAYDPDGRSRPMRLRRAL